MKPKKISVPVEVVFASRAVGEVQGAVSTDVIVVEAAEGDEQPQRMLMGTALPFSSGPGDNVGYTSVGPTRFLPGSINAALRPPVDRDHDRTRLVGRVTDAEADDRALTATVRLSRTPLGDETLALAEDEVTTGFSVTARPTEFSFEEDDEHGTVLVVAAAEWVGLAVTPFPAMEQARISQVAAQRGNPDPPEEGHIMELNTLVALLEAADNDEQRSELLGSHSDVLAEHKVTADQVRKLVAARRKRAEPKVEPADVDRLVVTAARLNEEDRPAYRDRHLPGIEAAGVTGEQFDQMVVAQEKRDTPPPQPVQIDAGRQSLAHTRPRVDVMDYVRWAEADIAAQAHQLGMSRGDAQAHSELAQIMAALSESDTTTGVGIVPPFFTDMILDGLPVHTPLTNNAVRRTGLPSVGMKIVKPAWTTLPEGDFYTTENTEPATDAVAIGTRELDILSWAHAVKASINLIERGTFGGFTANYYNQVSISYLSDKEARIADDMLAAVVAGPGLTDLSGGSVKARIAELVTAQINQQLDANGNFRGLTPTFAAVATDEWELLSGTDTDAGVAFGTAEVQIGSLSGRLGSLLVMLVPSLPSGGIIVGASGATELRDGAEMQLRQVIVNTMSVEVGVNANCSIDVEYPTALAANPDAFS